MSFLSFLGKLFLLDWLLGNDKKGNVVPKPEPTFDHGREDDYFEKAHALEHRIDELERLQDGCDLYSDRYDDLQDRIDDLQDELDEWEEFED